MDKFILGVIVGCLLMVALSCLPGSKINLYDKAIEKCEKELPRNQKCKIIGVVKE